MAYIRKKGGKWEVSIRRKGHKPVYGTFDTKLSATFWAADIEQELINGSIGKIPNKTFGDLLQEYATLVSPTKRGATWELHRINAFLRDPIADVMLCDLSSNHFAMWRDRRLLSVSAGSVLREINIMSHAINTAIKDWGWLKINPLSGIRRPPEPLPRDRLITDLEIEKLLLSLGYDYEEPPISISARIGAAMLFAIETAMRAGEIAGLTWDRVDLDKRTARLIETKNGTKRTVPLSMEAIRIINQLRDVAESDCGNIFNLNTDQIDVNFRKAKLRCMIVNLHFHDTRATAITRLSKKLDILSLARVSGHRDLKMLMVYYRETAEDMAKKL